LSLRLEDSFDILFSVDTLGGNNNTTKTNVNKINIKYLYPTINR